MLQKHIFLEFWFLVYCVTNPSITYKHRGDAVEVDIARMAKW